MLSFAVVLILAWSYRAIGQTFGCRYSSGKVIDDDVCLFSYGKLHMTCASYSWPSAQQACEAHGWELADITEQNLLFAQSMLTRCSFEGPIHGQAWIGSQNGLEADPCLVFSWNKTVALESYLCNSGYLQVLCQEIPVVTETTTTSTTTTTTYGTTTLYTRTSLFTQSTQAWEDLVVEKKLLAQDKCGPCGSLCTNNPLITTCNCCSDACPFTLKGLHLVPAEYLPYSEAEAVCCRHGWRLADFTSGMSGIIHTFFLPECVASDFEVAEYWIRSLNGVAGFECLSGVTNQNGTVFVMGHDQQYCINNYDPTVKRFALCQEEPIPAVTGYGPAQTWTTTSTIVSTSTTTTTVPSITETKTCTVTCLHDCSSTSESDDGGEKVFKRPHWIPE